LDDLQWFNPEIDLVGLTENLIKLDKIGTPFLTQSHAKPNPIPRQSKPLALSLVRDENGLCILKLLKRLRSQGVKNLRVAKPSTWKITVLKKNSPVGFPLLIIICCQALLIGSARSCLENHERKDLKSLRHTIG
jgi:hypothetical protein